MIPLDDPHRATTGARVAGVAFILLAGVAGWWWLESTRPGTSASSMERAGSPAPADPPRTESGAGSGASPRASIPAALAVSSSPAPEPERSDPFLDAIGRDGGTPPTDGPARRPFRSPLEQSPGYVPPADPESMSVVTGRRDAPLVTGEFAGGAPSAEALAQLVLDSFRNTNEMQLHEVRVTSSEFTRFLWREFPQSRPITNIQAADAWDMISTSSRAGAGKAYGLYAGRKLDVTGIEKAHVMAYRNFFLWRDVVVRARDTETGEELRLDFMPAIAERHGRYKVFSYRD